MNKNSKYVLILSLILLFSLISSSVATNTDFANMINSDLITVDENTDSIQISDNNGNTNIIQSDKTDKNLKIDLNNNTSSKNQVNKSIDENLIDMDKLTKENKTNSPISCENNLSLSDDIRIANDSVKIKNTSGIVMANDNYSCGPASLATVLNKLGLNLTLKDVSKFTNTTEENGTTMLSLINTAKHFKFNAYGAEIDVNDLCKNTIVHLDIDNNNHWSLVKYIKEGYVFLADSTYGNINLTIDEFKEYYTGKAIIISNKTTKTAQKELKSKNIKILNKDESSKISGKGFVKKIIGYKTVWKYGLIKKYGWKLQPVITPYGPKFSQWRYLKGHYYVFGKYKETIPIYRTYYVSDEKLTKTYTNTKSNNKKTLKAKK